MTRFFLLMFLMHAFHQLETCTNILVWHVVLLCLYILWPVHEGPDILLQS